jgi:hypothetical protein
MKVEYLEIGSNDCPLIRLYEYNQSEVHLLRELVRELATGVRERASLQDEAWAVPVGGCCLSLRRGSQDIGIRQAVPLNFECVLSSAGWSNVGGLLDPFCDSNTHGFQWLTHDGRISLLISQNGQW